MKRTESEQKWPQSLWIVRHGQSAGNVARDAAYAAHLSVIDIAERAVAGKLKGNPRADLLGDGVDNHDVPFFAIFPYRPDPPSGFDDVKGHQRP